MNDDDAERAMRARKMRSWIIAGGLVLFVLLIFVTTIVRLQGNIAARPL